jgi:hypothetical protein
VLAGPPSLADPEIAGQTFSDHIAKAMASSLAGREHWTSTMIGPRSAIVHMWATREDGTRDEYHLMLTADYYDQWPPRAVFVAPPDVDSQDWTDPTIDSRWMPIIDQQITTANQFAFHPRYQYVTEGNAQRQLICFSHSFDYYITGHGPSDGQCWKQGRHTLMATLSRIQEALRAPAYKGPAGALNS